MADYQGFVTKNPREAGEFVMELLEASLAGSPARIVDRRLSVFEGTVSPPGFASVLLLDESHATAHCYSDEGLLAVDCFTCGKSDPAEIMANFDEALLVQFPDVRLVEKQEASRFPLPIGMTL